MARQLTDVYIDAGPELLDPGPLTRTVRDFDRTMRSLVPSAKTSEDWAPLTRFVDESRFHRVGVFREEMDWAGYTQMLSRWAGATSEFQTKLIRVVEAGNFVFYEIEETHHRSSGDGVHIVNSMTVFSFDDNGKIISLNVYLQNDDRPNLQRLPHGPPTSGIYGYVDDLVVRCGTPSPGS